MCNNGTLVFLLEYVLNSFDVIVIGAGAAGLMCAATAAARGRSVCVLDHANKAGKKILMSGGGKCNFTNYTIEPENYLCANSHFCKSALQRYTQWDFIALVDKYDIPYHEKKHGQLFCGESPKAKASAKMILDMLLSECSKNKAQVQLKTDVQSIEYKDSKYVLTLLQSGIKQTVQCESLVIGCGGLSIPTMGATGFGYQIAQQFGLKTLPTRAGLVPYYLNDKQREQFNDLSGTSIEARLTCNGQSFLEDILFTHRGLSGPAVLQISSYWDLGDDVHVDMLPNVDLLEVIKTQRDERGKIQLLTLLSEFMSKKLAQTFLSVYAQSAGGKALADVKLASLSNVDITNIDKLFKHWLIKPPSTEGYRTAEVTLGGVDTDEVSSKTFEAKNQKGLFFIGEVLDVTGWLGGYNFQWAWASGYCAAQYV